MTIEDLMKMTISEIFAVLSVWEQRFAVIRAYVEDNGILARPGFPPEYALMEAHRALREENLVLEKKLAKNAADEVIDHLRGKDDGAL